MNKTAIKNFAIWARNKLIADISYKAGLLGITEKGIKSPLPQSTQTVQFFDIGTKEPSSIAGTEIQQRKKLVEEIERKARQSDYATAYKNVIEEVAYTWFNRLIAIRFMEVNDYLPTRIRVLSSESNGKAEPDLVTHALEANLDYSAYEKDRIIQLKHENKLDELFRMLFIKQCNSLNSNLPELFERTSDYTELLLNVSFTDKEGVVYHLVNDISEDDFNVSKEGQVEIIGWLYQYYNTEPKDETFALLKKNVKITKERIPAATQLFTPDWIVRYMVENSLGRLWLEGHPNDELKANWKYYLEEAEQEEEVQKQLKKVRETYKTIKPEDIKIMDPAMGSGHILVYAFNVLMQIYESYGYSQRDAAKSIIKNNLYGLDIDNRAYQLTYFAVMMKARQFNRRILNEDIKCQVFSIQESNDINLDQLKYFGTSLSDIERNAALLQIRALLDTFIDANEYGSILNVKNQNWTLLQKFIKDVNISGQISLESIVIEKTRAALNQLVEVGAVMSQKYDVVVTNPPYMGSDSMNIKLAAYTKKNFTLGKFDLYAVFIQKCSSLLKHHGFQAMITQHSWMFLSSFEKLRKQVLDNHTLVNVVHLGARAFEEIGGEVVQTVCWIMKHYSLNYNATYVRLVEPTTQTGKENAFLKGESYYNLKQSNLYVIPGTPIAYWISPNFEKIFTEGIKITEFVSTKDGLTTGNNEKFIKYFWEVSLKNIEFNCDNAERFWNSGKKYAPLIKGGKYRKWYGNNWFVITYDEASYKRLSQCGNKLPSRDIYFLPYVSWNRISTRMAFRYSENGYLFESASLIAHSMQKNNLMYFLAFSNSVLAKNEMAMINPTTNMLSGYVDELCIPENPYRSKCEELASLCVEISKEDWDTFETSWDFKRHALVNGQTLKASFNNWSSTCDDRFNKIKSSEEELNRIFIEISSLKKELNPEIEDNEITVSKADLGRDIRSFISYAVGCMFGRYNIDIEGLVYAGGEWDSSKYSSYIPDKDNILPITDEEYFYDDIVGLFVAFVSKVFGVASLEENLEFIANALDKTGVNPREIIRNYFVKDFYKDHCQIYQKRPIYWLFDSGKQNGFKALIYMHRYDENTIGNLRIDYLHRIQQIYENEIGRMQDTIENSKDAREVITATKRKEKLIKQLQETKEYDEKIAHLALARTSIDLDDGVKVNYEKVQTDRDGKKLDVLAKI